MYEQAPPFRDPATRDEVARLESALSLLFPRSRVYSDHAGPESAWINRITIPCGGDGLKVTITREIDGWQATESGGHTAPSLIEHPDRALLIEVLRDALHIALIYREVAQAAS
jgi:hypothetical protein